MQQNGTTTRRHYTDTKQYARFRFTTQAGKKVSVRYMAQLICNADAPSLSSFRSTSTTCHEKNCINPWHQKSVIWPVT